MSALPVPPVYRDSRVYRFIQRLPLVANHNKLGLKRIKIDVPDEKWLARSGKASILANKKNPYMTTHRVGLPVWDGRD